MKKFLTVLLVIAVMFTFSFGSAFAAEVDKTPIANAQAAGYTAVDNAATALLGNFTFDEDGCLTGYYVNGAKQALTDLDDTKVGYITKASVQAVIADAVTAAKTEIQKEATSKYNTASDEAAVTAGAAAVTLKAQEQVSGLANAVVPNGTDPEKLLAKEVKASKAAVEAELNGYTTSQYSDDTDAWAIKGNETYEGKYPVKDVAGVANDATEYSAKAFVEKVINTQKAAVSNAAGTDLQKIEAYKAASKIAKDIITGHKIAAAPEDYYVAAVPTATELTADTSVATAKTYAIGKMEAALAAKIADLKEAANDIISAESKKAKADTTKIAAYQAALAELDSQAAAAKEVYTARINAQKTVAAIYTKNAQSAINGGILKTITDEIATIAMTYANEKCTVTVLPGMVDITKDVAKLEDYAKLVSEYVDREGNVAFDANAVADALKDAKEGLYLGTLTLSQAKAKVDAAANISDALIMQKSKFIANIDGTGVALTIGTKSYNVWNAESEYEAAQLEAYKACVESTTKAIKGATSYDAIKEAYLAGYKTYDALITKTKHAADWNTGGTLLVEYTKNYKADLDAYLTYAAAKLGTDYSKATGDSKLADKVLDIVKKAYTKEEIPTQVTAAKAYLDSLKSNAALATEKKAVETLVAALPTKITLAEKDQVLAAKKANEDYADLAGAETISNELALKNSVKTLAALEKTAIGDQIAAINKAGVTVDSADAIKAVEDAIKAYEENYKAELAAEPADVAALRTEKSDLEELKADLSAAQIQNVTKMCAALNLNPKTDAEVKAIKDARAAFEALDIHQQAAMLSTYAYDKLSQAETAIAGNVTSLKLTAKSSAKKGSITVKWTVKGDASAADGYQVWKSTKQSKGYKKAITTTKKSYKNTKGLKKGTRYYYKVRAYKVVDGKKVYSDWSNKAYRVAK